MLIVDNSSLYVAVEHILQHNPKFIAVDTEFIRRKNTFFPSLSLVQICFQEQVLIIDVLSKHLNDYTPLKNIFNHPDIIKIFYDCSQDVVALSDILNIIPYPIVDLQAMIMLYKSYSSPPSYMKMVYDILGHTIDKSEKTSNWMIRPLSKTQIIYASVDVLYLYRLYQNYVIHDFQKYDLNKKSCFFEDMQNIYHNTSNILQNALSNYFPSISMLAVYCLSNARIQSSVEEISKKYNLDSKLVSDTLNKHLPQVQEIDFDEQLHDLLSICKIFIRSKCLVYDISYTYVVRKKTQLKEFIMGYDNNNIIRNGWRYSFCGKELSDFISGRQNIQFSLKHNKIISVNKKTNK
ncbi:MAG: 3'-5' exonuclease family protein [Candidatus Xenolissoclinum pacificiensis L6]|uniref:3'-5' exonuclease family protein n=1 Tax=Candidatus Xenolissoclinum pacificiensis L6 TaxID=1401685 RepID=W2V2K7_9RICK|nr:MAG: 3'-5' exonuclease family protein [Candidatus Xenolissoclinum pacificiensis L6]